MKILVVEDDAAIRKSLVQYLSENGYLVESCANFREASEKVFIYHYDACVFDIMLPDGSGIDLIKPVKDQHPDTGIIMLSAKGEIDDKINGLESGADDYISKPFHLQELNARLKSIIRRTKLKGNNTLTVGILEIYTENRTITCHKKPLELTGKEYDVLLFFATNSGKVLSKEAIAEHVWGDYIDQIDSLNFLYTHIKNLKKKLQQADAPDYIKTVYGIGYKFDPHES